MRRIRRTSALRARAFSLTLTITLLASPLSPFYLGRAKAATPVTGEVPSSTAVNRVAAHRDGEIIVRFRQGASDEDKNTTAASRGARRGGKLRGASGLERLRLEAGQDPSALAANLRLDPAVELAEPNYLITRDEVAPADPRFREQWALRNEGQAGGMVGSDVRAVAAWRETTGSRSTVVAIVDSGVNFGHPDLKNNRWTNTGEVAGNFLDDDRDGYADDAEGWDWVTDSGFIRDEQGHGTAVAGIIAAEGNNGVGISGVMWRASLMSLRVLDSTGTGDIAAAVEAIDYAVAHGAQVINCSWGTDADSKFLRDAIERAGRRGAVVVTSAGNDGRDIDARPYYPTSFDLANVISVASTDGFDNLAPFSNRGARRVGVAAPGVDILTTHVGGDYWFVSGTSASAPLVAGVAGLLKTLQPNLPPARVRSAILDGARRVDSLAGKVSSGGVADAAGALTALRGNPYAGNGGGEGRGGNGNRVANSNGQGGAQPYVPPALRRDNERTRANGKSGLMVDPPAALRGAPGANLPDLAQSRKVRTSPGTSAPQPTIHSDMACADCDPSGGGGAGGFYPNDPYLGTARTQSINETGDPGVDLGSQNFNWGLPLVSLPGRSGLDLSVSLYYNSLVWTRQGTVIEFNADHGTPAPGFQLGLPRLQAKYFDSDDNAYAYIMITPSGGRVQMKQTAVAGVYESADSSYTQLTEGSAPVVRTTDGTQFIFGLQVGGGAEWRCTQIKDRNGNFISAEYDAGTGHVTRITDTLARQVNFNYNGNGTLGSITQTQGGTTHTYATFYYAPKTLWLNFSGLLPVGAQSGETRTVLSSVVLSGNLDSYHFEYNSYGQVYQITHKAPDGHELAHTRYNLSDADLGGAAQTDCPRFSAKYDYAQDWNNNQEAVTTFQVTNGVTWTNPETSATESGTLSQQTSPDGTVYKEYSHSSGWGVGLPRLSEVWADADGTLTRQKWTSTRWTQDDASLPYPQNPRVEEVNVYDADGNRRRTTIEYNQGYGLPTHVREWGGPNMQTSVRMHATNYNLDLAYTSRRIIGLPFRREVWDANGVQSKYEYHYDYGGNFFEDTPAAATQHDRTNYGPGFITGRGNLADITHYNAKDPDNWAVAQVTRYRYNSAGSLVMVSDPEGHAQYLSFADSFSDGNNSRNTFAYPTKATDADGYFSTAQYNYHFGGVTLTRRPASGTGAGVAYVEEEVLYDQHLRVERVNNLGTGGYKKWVYTPDSKYVHTYETIRSPAAADELHTWQVFDGAGRVRAAASDHPGSQGLFSGQYFIYDRMGRLTQTSNPTEMSAAWSPAGDDAAWVFTTQAYDWMGRPTRTTNPDGTTRILSYGGCGCAGGEATTTQDEHGRKRRLTKDVLGRLSKVEEMNWDGTSVYSTTSYSYNSLDRLTQVDQQGQVRTFNYDGYGRLWKRTTPEQGTTEYAYNGDGTVQWAKDARGAKTKFIYNGRHLPASIEYDLTGLLSGQSAAATSNVSYTYDAAGHRTQMNDGQGTVTYHYDALGRMDWEERAFTGVGHFRLTYGYNTAGQLSSITNPWGAVVNYGYDLAGRLSSVGGANYAGVSTYVSSTSYRAFGALKGMSFSNGKALSTAYDNRLRPTTWNVSGVLGYNYNYDHFGERTGRVSYAQSLYNSSQDRSYEYDNVGRLIISHSGAEARAATGQGPWGIMDGPFSQGYEYDQWGNMTHRYGWGGEVQGGGAGQTSHLYYSYAGNRRTDHGFTYDNAGNLTFDGGQEFAYDATGQQVSSNYTSLLQGYDGDGLRVKKSEYSAAYTYYLRSSLLGGQVVAEINYQGGWQRGYVYAGQGLLAVQQGGVFFVHEDPVTKSKRVTDMAGALISAVETDPWGADTSASSASAFQPRKFTSYERDANGSDEAMFRRYNRWHSRFDQPDPYDGSYDLTDPQSLNRYAYVRNDPINFVDPAGLDGIPPVHLSIPPNLFPGVGFAATVYGYLGSGSMGGGGRLFAELYVPEESADGPGVTQSGGLTAEQLRERRDRRDKATQCYRDVYTQAARNFRDRRKEAYDRIAQQYPIAPTPAQNKSLGYAVGVTMLWAGARAGLPGAAISGVGTGILGLTAIFVENTHARLSAQWQASAEIRSMRDREIAEGSRNCYEQFGFKRSQLVL